VLDVVLGGAEGRHLPVSAQVRHLAWINFGHVPSFCARRATSSSVTTQAGPPDAPTDDLVILVKEKVGSSGDNVDIVLVPRKGKSKARIQVESDHDL